jgi:hypothetical protein
LFVERAVRIVERGGSHREVALECLGLCATLVVGAYAGHPEPFVFALIAIAAWSAWRCAHLALEVRRRSGSIGGAVRLAAALIGTGLTAAGIAAPQAMPFVEYLNRSVTVAHRAPVIAPSLVDWWPLAVFPDALGSPSPGFEIAADVPAPNYEQVNCSFAGATVLLLALIGLVSAAADRRARLFGAMAIAWLALTSNLANLGRAWDSIDWLGNFVPLSRSQPLWSFSLAVLAAVALERAAREGTDRLRRVAGVGVVVAGAAMLFSARDEAHSLLAANLPRAAEALKHSIAERAAREEVWISISSLVAIAILAALFWMRSAQLKRGLCVALLAIVFGQSG